MRAPNEVVYVCGWNVLQFLESKIPDVFFGYVIFDFSQRQNLVKMNYCKNCNIKSRARPVV